MTDDIDIPIRLRHVPRTPPPRRPAEDGDDGLRVGQVWQKTDGRSRGGHPKFYVIFRLTKSQVFSFTFCARTGEFRGLGGPNRRVFLIGMQKAGRVRDMPDVFNLDVEWFGAKPEGIP